MDVKGKDKALKRASINFHYFSYQNDFSQEFTIEYRPSWELRLLFGLEYV